MKTIIKEIEILNIQKIQKNDQNKKDVKSTIYHEDELSSWSDAKPFEEVEESFSSNKIKCLRCGELNDENACWCKNCGEELQII